MTWVADPAMPSTTMSPPIVILVTKFHSRNHQLSPRNRRTAGTSGFATPNQGM